MDLLSVIFGPTKSQLVYLKPLLFGLNHENNKI